MQTLIDETDAIVQCGFVTALIFIILYSCWHRWWRRNFGRSLCLLTACIIIVLGRGTLIEWHILGPDVGSQPSTGDWVVTNCLILIPLVFLLLIVQMVWHRYRRPDIKRSPLPVYRVPDSWRIYRPARRVGWALSPSGEWFLVDGETIVGIRRDPEAERQLNLWLREGTLRAGNDPLTDTADGPPSSDLLPPADASPPEPPTSPK